MDIDFEPLIQLQDIDEKIKKISLFLESVPPKIEEIDQKIKNSLQIAAEAKERLAQNQKKRRDLEGNVQDAKGQIAKFRQQLNNVKTNLEYRSLLKEIDTTQKKIDAFEEEIISEMLTADKIEADIKEAEKKAAQINEKLSEEKEKFIKKSIQEKEQREKYLSEKEKICKQIPSEQFNLYQTIFKKNNGIALSLVTSDFCSICQIRIRPQVLNELKEDNQIILCENCGRILYCKKNSG